MGSRAAVLQVRIHLPPAESPRTIGSCRTSFRSVTRQPLPQDEIGELAVSGRNKRAIGRMGIGRDGVVPFAMWNSAGLMLMAAISASETTMPLGYWPVSSSQRTVRPVLVVVAEISSTITRYRREHDPPAIAVKASHPAPPRSARVDPADGDDFLTAWAELPGPAHMDWWHPVASPPRDHSGPWRGKRKSGLRVLAVSKNTTRCRRS